MKTILFIFLFSACCFGQTSDAEALAGQFQAAKNRLFNCYYDYFTNDKSDNKLDNFKKCEKDAEAALSAVYATVAKNPEAMRRIISAELGSSFRDTASGVTSKAESRQDSQVQLLRIIVLQNQRIIELLEAK